MSSDEMRRRRRSAVAALTAARERRERLERAARTKPDSELIAEAISAGRLRRVPTGVSGGEVPLFNYRSFARRA